jgi:hypothetical protein
VTLFAADHVAEVRELRKATAPRAFLYEVYQDAEKTLAAGDVISTRQFTLMRLALNNVTSAALSDYPLLRLKYVHSPTRLPGELRCGMAPCNAAFAI